MQMFQNVLRQYLLPRQPPRQYLLSIQPQRQYLLPGQQPRRWNSNNIAKVLDSRGMLKDVFPKENISNLVHLLSQRGRGVYAGFDPTADGLHIGNLVVVMGLLHAQRSGHKPIALIGGGTGRIGDPSGKSLERPALDGNQIAENIAGLQKDLTNIFQNHERHFWPANARELSPLTLVNNDDWYSSVNIIEFLSSVGRHFRLGTMLGRHSVKSRLSSEEGMSFTEFTYQTLQAYDWLTLLQESDCLVQLGGSDQMGNIMAGQELVSRVLDQQVFGMTMPLITSESGDKFGKSAGTPVWLSADKTSPFQVYQYMLRRPDAEVEQLLKTFTFLNLSEISTVMDKHQAAPEKRYAQERLAESLTLLLHGEQGLLTAQRSTAIIYKGDMKQLSSLNVDEARSLFQQADYLQKLYSPGINVLDFAVSIGCFSSEKDALRIICAGGFYMNQARFTNPDEVIVHGIHILDNGITMVRVGKKNYYIVEWT